MAIRLEIHPRKDLGDGKSWEHIFDQGEVTIGRASSNDVTLQDPQRVVSSRHAEIRRKANACVLVDMGSTNGTRMNEQSLVPQREYPLQEGDRIVIGDFTILFSVQTPQTNGMAHNVVEEPQTAVQGVDADALVYELCRRYAELQKCTTQEREAELLEMLRRALAQQVGSVCESLMGKIRAGLCLRLGQPAAAPLPAEAAPAQPVRTDQAAGEAAYRGLLAIAQKYCLRLPSPTSAEFIGQFARRIDQVLQITFGNLVESLRGRRQFARELEVEATRILNWAPNQIKQAENEQQVGAYLFDALANPKDAEAVMADLQRVFRDLALHHIGVIKGFEESLRAVLREFDPATIEAEFEVSPVEIGPLRLPPSFRLLKQWGAWKHFKRKHRRFTEEEVRIFEQILAPHFAKGYLDVQKTQRGR
ncbi:MAG TPA: type VI secretion system-associated FHA domain protein TagH [Nitrospira sp.]|nr:type VI secretion system-associated FHA domain protein TagH [Nitrospira sp.]